jgi:hypothetical protein
METIKKLAGKALSSLQNLTQSTSPEREEAISIYSGELTLEVVNIQTTKLLLAFPTIKLQTGWFELLNERIRANGFSDARLIAAVDHLIDTCIYPVPSIANIISYDKKVKLYTYQQLCDITTESGDKKTFLKYKPIRSNHKVQMYCHVNDIDNYKLIER